MNNNIGYKKNSVSAVSVLITINVVLFIPYLIKYITGISIFNDYLLIFGGMNAGYEGYPGIFNGHIYQLLTSMFIHGDLTHLIFNMYGLFIFGSNLEKRWGKGNFITFYIVVGVFANICSAAFFFFTGVPARLIGASGAIYGVLLAFGAYNPNVILVLFFFIPMKVKWVIPVFAFMELAFEITGSLSGIAHITHLMGFVGAFLYLLLFFRINAIKKIYFPGKYDYEII